MDINVSLETVKSLEIVVTMLELWSQDSARDPIWARFQNGIDKPPSMQLKRKDVKEIRTLLLKLMMPPAPKQRRKRSHAVNQK